MKSPLRRGTTSRRERNRDGGKRTGSRIGAVRTWAGRLGIVRWIDVLFALTALVLYIVSWSTMHLTHSVPYPVQPFVALAVAGPVVFTRTAPAFGWAASALAALVYVTVFPTTDAVMYAYPWQVVHIIALLVLVAGVAAREALPVVGVVWLATGALFWLYVPGADGPGWAVGLSVLVAFSLLVRWLARSRKQLAVQEEIGELERARRAILEERTRIARDLHDVVAHHMSMVVVQAQSARYRLDGVTDEIAAEFDSIGSSGRAALDEIRGMLGVLRSDGQHPEDAPQPSALDVPALVEGSKRAGIDVHADISGDPAVMADAPGMVVYRIVQESLANGARHAPGARIDVTMDFGHDGVHLRVVNGPGLVPAQPGTSGGTGIEGMQERARAVGGSVIARPTGDGGFAVTASIPSGGVVGVAAPSRDAAS